MCWVLEMAAERMSTDEKDKENCHGFEGVPTIFYILKRNVEIWRRFFLPGATEKGRRQTRGPDLCPFGVDQGQDTETTKGNHDTIL